MANNQKPDNEKPVPIVTTPVKVVKRSALASGIRSFLADEAGKIWKEAIVPEMKSVVMQFMNAILYGSSNYSAVVGRTDYRSASVRQARPIENRIIYSNRSTPQQPQQNAYNVVTAVGSDYNAISFASFADAQRVLEELRDVIARDGVVRVSKFYEKCGIACYYNEEYFGWTNLDGVTPTHSYLNDGWFLRLPKAMPIDRI